MADDVLQFVDSIAASPTVRLNMNDNTNWGTRLDTFDCSPPPLRRAVSSTLLADGGVVSDTAYDFRVLRLTFEVLATTVDNVATQTQALHRELDRETNYLKWQPNGATSPVFFRTYRTSPDRIAEVGGAGTMKTFDVSILAEPFALGLREDVAVGTVNNDPAAGSNGLYFDVSSVKGDVATPAFITGTAGSANAGGVIGVRQHGTVSDMLHFIQAESMTVLTAPTTANPGGGPDAAMSGTGTNNYMRITFNGGGGTTGQLEWAPTLTTAQRKAMHGRYRAFVVVRRGDNTTPGITLSIQSGSVLNTAVSVPLTTSRQIIDLGLIDIGGAAPTIPGRYSVEAPIQDPDITITGTVSPAVVTKTLDIDYLMLVPADEQMLLFSGLAVPFAIDGLNEAAYLLGSASTPFAGTVQVMSFSPFLSGGFPSVTPGQTTRFVFAVWAGNYVVTKADTTTLTLSYYPRYLYLRPAST